jgi:hydroxymethylbilane synthase
VTTLRIATRRSALALAQAEEIAGMLSANAFRSEIVPMSTSGDEGAVATGSASGMKGLWIDRIVEALRAGEVDVAVHSAKDLPAEDEEGIVIAAVPKRADPLDVLIGRHPKLQPGMVVGTSSLRRRAQLLAGFPGMAVTEIRGNVDTRLRKLSEGEVDGLVLAAAGLSRLGLDPAHARRLRVDEMVPAPGQGCLAVQAREDDRNTRAVLSVLDHAASRRALEAERALTKLLGGGCDVPIGAFAAAKDDRLRLVAVVATADGA